MAEQSAWHASVQREDAHKQQQQHDNNNIAAAAAATAAAAQQTAQAAQPAAAAAASASAGASVSASPPPSGGGLGDLGPTIPSLFPSLLSPSPFHHSPSHSIVTLSAAAPSLIPPSPLLSESPTLAPQQHQHLGNEHILNNPRLIVNVWQSNLQEELAKILQIVDEYNYIAMDTEFPGVVARPGGTFKTSPDYAYQTLKCNVDLLKIIQLGLCFCDAAGNIHPGTCTWQFNFQFNLSTDMYAQDSIDLLSKSGIDFAAHEKNGISTADFGEWLMTSGIVLNEEVKWISFHSGFDFGYLLKILTCAPLPTKEDDFFALLQLFFPCIYDIKYLMDSCSNLHGGLSKIAELLNVIRIGPQHQAGSDSLLTAATFFKLKETHFNALVNPAWAETAQNRNAVRREQRLAATSAGAAHAVAQAQQGGSVPYAVITNTDPLSLFDTKFLGMLHGYNNDYTEGWKKKTEREREKRHRKEQAISNGQSVSSDDDDLPEPPSAGHANGNAHGSDAKSSSSSHNFVPQQHGSSYGSGNSHLPMTPQKSSSGGHHSYHGSPHHEFSPSPQQHHVTSKLSNKNTTGGHGMHRNRYGHGSHDFHS